MQAHVTHEIFRLELRSGSRDASASCGCRQHEVTSAVGAYGSLHCGEVRTKSIRLPGVEAHLPDGRSLRQERIEGRLIRVMPRRATEANIGGIVNLVKR